MTTIFSKSVVTLTTFFGTLKRNARKGTRSNKRSEKRSNKRSIPARHCPALFVLLIVFRSRARPGSARPACSILSISAFVLFRHLPAFCPALDALIASYRRFLAICEYLHVCPLSVPQRAPQRVPEREKGSVCIRPHDKSDLFHRTSCNNLKSYNRPNASGCYRYSVFPQAEQTNCSKGVFIISFVAQNEK